MIHFILENLLYLIQLIFVIYILGNNFYRYLILPFGEDCELYQLAGQLEISSSLFQGLLVLH